MQKIRQQMSKMKDEDDEFRSEPEKFKEHLGCSCHCVHVGVVFKDLRELDEAMVVMSEQVDENTEAMLAIGEHCQRADARTKSIESKLDPWKGRSKGEQTKTPDEKPIDAEIDGDDDVARRSGATARWIADDCFSKRKTLTPTSVGGTSGQSKFFGWQDEPASHLSSKKFEVGRLPYRAPLQKGTVDLSIADGVDLCKSSEALASARQICDALKSGTAGETYGIVKRAEPFAAYDCEGETV